jgi:hypothetical protein
VSQGCWHGGLFALFVPRAFHISFTIKRFCTLSENCRVSPPRSSQFLKNYFNLLLLRTNSFCFTLLRTLLRPSKMQLISFQAIRNSFAEILGGGAGDSPLWHSQSWLCSLYTHRSLFTNHQPQDTAPRPFLRDVPTFRRSDVPTTGRVPNRTERCHPYGYNLCAILASLRPEDRSVPPSWRSS